MPGYFDSLLKLLTEADEFNVFNIDVRVTFPKLKVDMSIRSRGSRAYADIACAQTIQKRPQVANIATTSEICATSSGYVPPEVPMCLPTVPKQVTLGGNIRILMVLLTHVCAQ